MKLENMEFSEKNDLRVLKALKRTIKDFLCVTQSKENGFLLKYSNKTLVSKCYHSRRTHSSETINVNYTYWLHDIGTSSVDVVFHLIWLMRVISIIGDDNLESFMINSFREKIRSLASSSKLKNIDYLMENQDLLYSMTKIKSLSFPERKYKELMKTLEKDKVGIPF